MLPASAGMIPLLAPYRLDETGAPRIRGDDPLAFLLLNPSMMCSPHPRG